MMLWPVNRYKMPNRDPFKMTKFEDGAIIRAIESRDVARVTAIYNHYIRTSIISFEEEPVTATEIARRVADVHSASLPWLIAEESGQIAGYAYARRWRARSAYRFSVEATVYVAPERTGQGYGSKLYGQMLPLLKLRRVHAVMGGIALPNEASIALHEKFGFRKVAHFQEVGLKFDRWIDVGYWQLTLYRDTY